MTAHNPARILVTGGTGYVGSVVTAALASSASDVTVLSTAGEGRVLVPAGVRLLRADLRSAREIREALKGIGVVVHLASVRAPACLADAAHARTVNVDATRQLVDLAAEAGVQRVIYASSCSCYGQMPPGVHAVTEDSAPNPLSPYAEMKVEAEQACLARSSAAMACVVLRLATVFGVSPRMRFELPLNFFIAQLATTGHVTVDGARLWRPYVHVRDVAAAIAATVAAPFATVAGEIFNVGTTAENYRRCDVVELIRRQLHRPTSVTYIDGTDDPRSYRVSCDKLSARLAWQARYDVPRGIREVLTCVWQEQSNAAGPREATA